MIHAQQEEVKTALQNFLHAFENCELSARNGSSLQIANRPQDYICVPCPNPATAMCPPNNSGFAWILFTPQATLFADNDKQVITHFFSPNPF